MYITISVRQKHVKNIWFYFRADNVAKGIVESLHKGENGSVWVVEDEKGVFKIEVPEIEIMKI